MCEMREIISMVLFFFLVGVVHVLMINAIFKTAQKRRLGPSAMSLRSGSNSEGQPPSRGRLPQILLRLIPSR